MRAVLLAWSDTERRVWVADSFQGLPAPDEQRYPACTDRRLHDFVPATRRTPGRRQEVISSATTSSTIRSSFFRDGSSRYAAERSPSASWPILRLDGDLYEIDDPGA